MNEDFINEVTQSIHIRQPDLVEKDLLIHKLLSGLAADYFFYKNFLFKGGTCLVKSFLGYYRFSEDIDFTWENQSIFFGTSASKRRKFVLGPTESTFKRAYRISVEQS